MPNENVAKTHLVAHFQISSVTVEETHQKLLTRPSLEKMVRNFNLILTFHHIWRKMESLQQVAQNCNVIPQKCAERKKVRQ